MDALRGKVVHLSYDTASGGGVNRKMMPDPVTGKLTVPMDEVFSFDRGHAICRVETNSQAFTMPTYAMGDVTIGSRSAAEHATYKVEAVDGGPRGGSAGDTFAFAAFFDPEDAPVNHAIFGPEFTFTGLMVEGEITILDPRAD